MSLSASLATRSDSQCEFCKSSDQLSALDVPPSDGSDDQMVVACQVCREQIQAPETMDANHWRCLNDSMWSPTPAVQVMSYRLLHALKAEGWPQDLLDMMYLEDDIKKWADSGLPDEDDDRVPTKDSNGTLLQEGDNVTIIKDLEVKGAGFTAKRGTMVKNIHLVENPLHIEGKVNGTQVVLVAAYMKKA